MIRQTTRLPAPLHTWLIERAKANHRSLNAELISILTAEAAKNTGVSTGGDFAAIEKRTMDMVSGTQERGQ